MPNVYAVGDLVQLTATFATPGGTTVNPTAVNFFIKKPSGVILTPSPSNPSTGVFTTQVSLDVAGEWLWRAVGTGSAQAASDPGAGVFEVAPNAF